MRALCLALTLALVLPNPALAWGPTGHRITAKIGEDNMDPAAREAMQAITGARSLALLATWPDFIRSFPEYDCLKPMHFLTVEDGQPVEEALQETPFVGGKCKKEDLQRLGIPMNVVGAIDFFTAVLKGDNAKTQAFAELLSLGGAEPLHGSIELTALALLVHFAGDVHQPLHVGRGADRGGNSVMVDWFGKLENLHMVWDELLIERKLLSYTEFADFLEQDFADRPAVEYGGGPVAWAEESVVHRAAAYEFGSRPGQNLPELSYEYADRVDALLNQRLYEGGRRLAEHLDRIYGP